MTDNLDSLNNTLIREKCIQYGLPNVPVTDSSRKVLIRRLRTSMAASRHTNIESEVPCEISKNIASSKETPEKECVADSVLGKKQFADSRQTRNLGVPDAKNVEYKVKDRVRSSYANISNDATQQMNRINSKTKPTDQLLSQRIFRKDKDINLSTPNQNDEYSCNKFSAENMSGNSEIFALSSPTINQRQFVKGSMYPNATDLLETPYLSNFARSLERLKNNSAGRISPSFPIQAPRDVWPHYERKSRDACDDDIGHKLNQFLTALEQKYHLKRNFALVFLFLLIVFIYVFFIM